MRLNKINLKNPIKNNNNSTQQSPKSIQQNTKLQIQTGSDINSYPIRYKSFNTIDISFGKQFTHKLIQTNKNSTKSSGNSYFPSNNRTKNLIQKQINENDSINSNKNIKKHLNQVLLSLDPDIKVNKTTKKLKAQNIPINDTIKLINKQYIEKYSIKKQQKQQIPNYIKVHLLGYHSNKAIDQNRMTNQNNQLIQQTNKKKSKFLLPPLPNKPRNNTQQQIKGSQNINKQFSPYVTEYRLIESRSKSKQPKIKNSERYLSQQKSKRKVYPKYSLQNIIKDMDMELCGWSPEQ